MDLIGTGVPIITPRYGALVTATHVLDDIDGNEIIVGRSQMLHRIPKITSKFSYTRGGGRIDVDVAAVALPAKVVKELSDFYQFTTANELGKVEENDKLTFYGLIGCPLSKNKFNPKQQKMLKIKPYFYVTREIVPLSEIETSGKTDVTHFALRASLKKILGPGGKTMQAPKPQGISGCGVWRVRFNSESGEASAPQLVGIGIEYFRTPGIFIATEVGAAAIVLSRLGQQLEDGEVGRETLSLRWGDASDDG